MRTENVRRIERQSYHRRRARHLEDGLTAHGTTWRRTPTLLPSKREANRKAKELARQHRRTQRRAALGLNSRGKPYKTLVMERAWKRLRGDVVAPDFLTPLERAAA